MGNVALLGPSPPPCPPMVNILKLFKKIVKIFTLEMERHDPRLFSTRPSAILNDQLSTNEISFENQNDAKA